MPMKTPNNPWASYLPLTLEVITAQVYWEHRKGQTRTSSNGCESEPPITLRILVRLL